MPHPVIEKILKLFAERGENAYLGEAVSQKEHALQSALAAEECNGSCELIVAALLHDIGHLLHSLPEDCADHGIDDRHEELGYRFLVKYFTPAISEAVRLHVPAKRYLCALEPSYHAGLSPSSQQSLQLQGGVFSPDEARSFRSLPHAELAVTLRRCDDMAKTPGKPTPSLDYYVPHMEKCLAG